MQQLNMNISKNFTPDELEFGFILANMMTSVPVQEKPLLKDIERVNRYNQLRGFQFFLKHSGVNENQNGNTEVALDLMNEILKPYNEYYDKDKSKYNILEKIEMRAGSQKPLQQDSTEEESKNSEDMQDEIFQQLLFQEDFYTVEKWMKEKKLTCDPNNLSEEEQMLFNDEYIRQFIRQVKRLHTSDRTFDTTRRESLSQNITILNPQPKIFQKSFEDYVSQDGKYQVYCKAIIPVLRERYRCTYIENNGFRPTYSKLDEVFLQEQMAFCLVTTIPMGYIPPVTICKQNAANDYEFFVDTIMFSDINSEQNTIIKDIEATINHLRNLDIYKIDNTSEGVPLEFDKKYFEATLLMNEMFLTDLMKKQINFELRDSFKNYLFLPLNVNIQMLYHLLQLTESKQDHHQYSIDWNQVMNIIEFSKNYQNNTLSHYLKQNGLTDYTKDALIVGKGYPNITFEVHDICENIDQTEVKDILLQIKTKFKDAYQGIPAKYFLYNYQTKLQTIKKFREEAFAMINEENQSEIKNQPIIFLKEFTHLEMFKFSYKLSNVPQNPNIVCSLKNHEQKILLNKRLPTIHHSMAVTFHYLDKSSWYRACQMPQVLNYIERIGLLKDLKENIFKGYPFNEEYMLWATTAPGLYVARRNYEVLETYGDTILKLAATMLAYYQKRNDKKAGEGEIENSKVCFVTNFHIFRVGNNLMLQKYMKTKRDSEYKQWVPPMSTDKDQQFVPNQCVGKNVADCVESLICALYLSSNCLHTVLRWISEIKLVPLDKSTMLDYIEKGTDCTFRLYSPLHDYKLQIQDQSKDLFNKFFMVEKENVPSNFKDMLQLRFETLEVDELGSAYDLCRYLKGEYLIKKALVLLEDLQENVLNYKFKNPLLLIEALTHKSAKDQLEINLCYEKLEVLGDSILDYLCNYSLIYYTMFERYIEKDPVQYQIEEHFTPSDAHQSKSLLVKNELLAKITVLLGIHKYIFYQDTLGLFDKKEVSDYLKYSFRPNFRLNQREVELFECPKLLGDVFESLMGAIFIDGGMNAVIQVFRNLVGPFVLFIAQFSKKLYKEPKEEFLLTSHSFKIKPQYKFYEVPVVIQVDEQTQAEMIKAEVIFNNGEVMCTAYGSNKKQAERNASVEGLNFIDRTYKGLII
eukprot:403361874